MNKRQIILAGSFLISVLQLDAYEWKTMAGKKVHAENILKAFDDAQDKQAFVEKQAIGFRNEHLSVRLWFEEHALGLQSFLRGSLPDDKLEVKIMGSFRWQTNHILSDIDAVVVTNFEDKQAILDALSFYYKKYYNQENPVSTITRAGLPLFIMKNFCDQALGEMQLEYTVQTPEVNQQIIDGMTKAISREFKPDDSDNESETSNKTWYALAMMRAVCNGDDKMKMSLKLWTRVLPQK